MCVAQLFSRALSIQKLKKIEVKLEVKFEVKFEVTFKVTKLDKTIFLSSGSQSVAQFVTHRMRKIQTDENLVQTKRKTDY